MFNLEKLHKIKIEDKIIPKIKSVVYTPIIIPSINNISCDNCIYNEFNTCEIYNFFIYNPIEDAELCNTYILKIPNSRNVRK